MKKFVKNQFSSLGIKAWLIAISWYCFSCGGDVNTKAGLLTEYYLEKVDSIRVDRETNIRVLDVNRTTGHFLAADLITEEFLVLDSRGQILEEVYRRGEGPNEYNNDLLALSFNQEEGGYIAQSTTEQIRFNDSWEVDGRIRFSPHYSVFFYGGPRMGVPYYRTPNDSAIYFFTHFLSGVNAGIGAEEVGEVAAHLIEQYNPQKQGLEWVFPFDSERLPKFDRDEKSKDKKPVQVYALEKEKGLMYLTFERSTEVGIYELANNFELKEKMEFSHATFNPSHNSKNIGLYLFNSGLMGVLYYKGISEVAAEARKSANEEYAPYMDPSLYQFIVLEDGKQQKQEIEFPFKCEPRREILVLPGNRLMLRDKYTGNTEPEFYTFSIFELKER